MIDLNVPIATAASANAAEQQKLIERFVRLIELGYTGAAVNEVVTGRITSPRKPRYNLPLPLPPMKTPQLQQAALRFRQFSRITVVMNARDDCQCLSTGSQVLSAFDIVAAQPTSDKLFAQCTEKLDVDIISLDLTTRLDFFVKAPQARSLGQRGIFVEIPYAPALRDRSICRYIIANAQNLVRITRGRHMVLVSEAEQETQLRSPHDVANLAHIFGLNHETAADAVRRNPEKAVQHGFMRTQTHRSVVYVSRLSDVPATQQWRIPPAIPAPLAQPKTHHDLLSSKTRTERKADATEKQEVALKPTAAADRVTQASASADQPLTKMKRAKSKPGSMGQHQAAAAGPDEGQPPKKAKALTS